MSSRALDWLLHTTDGDWLSCLLGWGFREPRRVEQEDPEDFLVSPSGYLYSGEEKIKIVGNVIVDAPRIKEVDLELADEIFECGEDYLKKLRNRNARELYKEGKESGDLSKEEVISFKFPGTLGWSPDLES